MTAPDWQPIANCPQDGSYWQLYCPGVSSPTNGVLVGGWLARLGIWQLYPYGTTQPVALTPTMYAPLTEPPG